MAIALSQIITGTGGSISSLNVVFSSVVTAGNSIVVHYSGGGFPVASTPVFDPTDNVNAGAYSTAVASTISVASAPGQSGICHKLAIAAGGAASTYRVRFAAFGQVGFFSMAAREYSGIGSLDKTAASTGTSSSPTCGAGNAANANSLWSAVGGPFTGSTLTMRSTGLPDTMIITIVDQNNANQLMGSGELITSSLALTAQPTFRVAVSTGWLAPLAIYAPSVAGTGVRNPDVFTLMGMQ